MFQSFGLLNERRRNLGTPLFGVQYDKWRHPLRPHLTIAIAIDRYGDTFIFKKVWSDDPSCPHGTPNSLFEGASEALPKYVVDM